MRCIAGLAGGKLCSDSGRQSRLESTDGSMDRQANSLMKTFLHFKMCSPYSIPLKIEFSRHRVDMKD